MPRTRSALAALATVLFPILLLATLTAPVASAQVKVESEVTWDESGDGSVSNVRLHVFRDGVEVLNLPPVRPCAGCELQPVPPDYQPPARVLQLDATPEPEVVFTLASRGAHCCIYAEVFRWDEASGRYLLTLHDFEDFGFRLKNLGPGGRPVFVSSDSRFAYRYSCFPCAIYPPRVWEYRGGKFSDVTRAHPGEVKKSLARANRLYRRIRDDYDPRGVLAGLVADKCLLGNCAGGFKVVRKAIRKGYVRRRDRYEIGAHGRRYLQDLRRFLGRLGYA
ncbi:MAG: hypothetical protein M3Y75_13070 [Actinomycetota bacterium]|nr:hypothetical protein [Actinomycetota bacterium]